MKRIVIIMSMLCFAFCCTAQMYKSTPTKFKGKVDKELLKFDGYTYEVSYWDENGKLVVKILNGREGNTSNAAILHLWQLNDSRARDFYTLVNQYAERRQETQQQKNSEQNATNAQNQRLADISAQDYMNGPSQSQASVYSSRNRLKVLEQNRNVHNEWDVKVTRFVQPRRNIPCPVERKDQSPKCRYLSPDVMQRKYKGPAGTIQYSSQVNSKESPTYTIYSDTLAPSKNISKSSQIKGTEKKDNSDKDELLSTTSLIEIPKGEVVTVGVKNNPIPVTLPQPKKNQIKLKEVEIHFLAESNHSLYSQAVRMLCY